MATQKDPKHVSKVDVKNQKGTAAPQAPIESGHHHEHMMMMRMHHHHLHRHWDLGFPHPEEGFVQEEKEDDSDSPILRLLWTYQDCFDPKVLSKAQAEYSFYRTLEKQWKKTLNRVRMEELKYPKFAFKDFIDFPKRRTLYLVIDNLIQRNKEKPAQDAGVKAAEEYHRYSVLEHHMAQQQMISSVPQGVELDQATFNEIKKEIEEKFKRVHKETNGKFPAREMVAFKSVALWEYLKIKETITSQRQQIDDLASKLSGIASQQLADGDPGFTDLGDKNRPQKLGERFAELFDETWSSAYEALKPKNPDADDDESDEGTMDVLQQIVRVIYDYCQRVSEEQIQRLMKDMIPPILDPTSDKPSGKETEQIKSKTEQMAREYRKVVAGDTVAVLQKEIFEKEIKGKKLTDPIPPELKTYVDQCVDLIWYMCIQQPPMEIRWAKEGEKFNREQFRFSGRKGKTYKLTVWPAVFLHKDGPLVAAGYAVPNKK